MWQFLTTQLVWLFTPWAHWSNDLIECLRKKGAFRYQCWAVIVLSHCKVLQYKWLSSAVEMTFTQIDRTEWFLKSHVRSKWHGSKLDWHHGGYLLKISDTCALTGQNGYKKAHAKPQWYGSVIDVNQWLHFVGSGRHSTLLKKVK
jgi:hypothetical protein